MSHRILSVSVHNSNGRRGEGLKRQMFTVALAGCDLLAGANGAGKTTRGPLAITAAIEGLASVPTDPRRPYVGGLPELTAVTLEVQTPGGVEKLTRDLSAARGKAVDEANRRARDLVGIPPTAWDLRDFAAGTDGDRGKILDAVARAGGAIERWDAKRAQDHVRGLLGESMAEGAEPAAWTAPLDVCISVLENAPDGATWLQTAQIWAEPEQTRANTAQREAGAHLGELTASVPTAPRGDPTEDETARRSLLQREAALASGAAEVRTAEAARDRHVAEGQRLRESMAATEAEGKRLGVAIPAPDTTVPADVTKRLADAKAALDAPVEAYEGASPATRQEVVDQAARLLTVARAAAHASAAALEEIDARQVPDVSAIDRRHAAARSAVSALESASGQGHATCRHCSGDDPLGVAAQLEEARVQEASLAEEFQRASIVAGQHSDARSAAYSAAAKCEAAVKAADATLATARAHLEAAISGSANHATAVRARRESAVAAAQAEFDRETKRAAARATAHASDEEGRKNSLAAARTRWAAARDALAAWEKVPAPVVPAPPTDAERAAIASELAVVDARIEGRREHAAHIARVKAAATKFEGAKLRWDATRALIAALRQARDDVAAAAYAPIDRAARELVEGAPGLPVPFFAGPSDFGAVVRGGRVPYAGLSESEQRITASALVYALATVSGCPCRLVMIDGIEVIQKDHRQLLLAALARAQRAGRVDSVVLTMATAPGEVVEAVEGLTVHLVVRDAVEADEASYEVPLPVAVASTDSMCPF